MSGSLLVCLSVGLALIGAVLGYLLYNAPLYGADGMPIPDDDSVGGGPEGDFNAVLRKRDRDADSYEYGEH